SSFYKWCQSRSARAARQAADDALCEWIGHHFEFWDHTYGCRRFTAKLAEVPDAGGPVNHKRVARLMREHNIVGVHLRKPHTSTMKDPSAQVFADLVKRDFTATGMCPRTATNPLCLERQSNQLPRVHIPGRR